MKRYRIVPKVNISDMNVWMVQEEIVHRSFWSTYSTWKDVEWYEDFVIEGYSREDRRIFCYMPFKKYYFKSESQAEAYIDKHLKIERSKEKHLSIPPREYP